MQTQMKSHCVYREVVDAADSIYFFLSYSRYSLIFRAFSYTEGHGAASLGRLTVSSNMLALLSHTKTRD